MRRYVTCLFTLLASLEAGEPRLSFEKVVRYSETVSGNEIEVALHQGEYDFSRHEITKHVVSEDRRELIKPAAVDGVSFAGTEGHSPFNPHAESLELITINDINLSWNGEKVSVSKELHVNLLGLTLRRDCIQFIPRPSGEELLIQATGGDGGSGYLVSLVLRKNGTHTQYECGYCEDGLRPFPYKIEKIVGKDEMGRQIVESFDWLEGSEQVVPPKSDRAGG